MDRVLFLLICHKGRLHAVFICRLGSSMEYVYVSNRGTQPLNQSDTGLLKEYTHMCCQCHGWSEPPISGSGGLFAKKLWTIHRPPRGEGLLVEGVGNFLKGGKKSNPCSGSPWLLSAPLLKKNQLLVV